MADININDLSALNLTGAELFNDSESFITELNEEGEEMGRINGGLDWCRLPTCKATEVACDLATLDTITRFA
ncbi:hypothetical protein [Moorena sp. SIO4G3]|uniref:hypothetical protein n=1 Tax=Moorena sp. SIO4G3 TaxID=2607821 RepID=UPI00142CFC0F|nr:hypothetical protein [Moorena sp. SIO4G3]NEO82247.1 hypothetical protein [Moorena sp. SIO4G3]